MTNLTKGAANASLLALMIALPGMAKAQDVTIGGRLMIDYTIADLDGADADVDGAELRRARLFVKGDLSDTISYKVEINKTGDDAFNAEDAYVEFAPKSIPVKIRVGQDNTPASISEISSSRFTSTIERAAYTDAFAFDRRLGVTVLHSGDNYAFEAGVYGQNLEADGFDTDGRAVAAHGSYTPIKTKTSVLHLGGTFRYTEAPKDNDIDSDDNLIRYRQRPFTHTTSDRIVATNRFADSDVFFGAEALYMNDGLWAHGEYGVLAANGEGDNEDADFSGGFAEIGYFFGGRRTYGSNVIKRYKVDKPVGEGGYGAFSVVARYDTLDLDDGPFDQTLDTVVLGVDWYPTTHTRFGLNYFNSDADNGSFESGEGVVGRLYFDF